jgi:hypothetical protein
MNSNTVQKKQLRSLINASNNDVTQTAPSNDQEYFSHVERFYEFEKFVQASKQVQEVQSNATADPKIEQTNINLV